MNLKQMMEAALNEARSIAQKAKDENRPLTDEEITSFDAKMAEVDGLKAQIKRAEESDARFKALAAIAPEKADSSNGDGEVEAKTLGEFFVKQVGAANLQRLRSGELKSLSSPEFSKANTDVHVVGSVFDVVLTDVDRTIVRPFRRPLVSDLLGSGSISGTMVKYFIEGAVEDTITTVAEGGQKPQIHFLDPTTQTDTVKKIAAWWDTSDEMVEDLPFMVSEINNRGLELLSMAEEAQLIRGDGTGSNLTGILNRSGIQTVTQADATHVGETKADAIFRAMTNVQTATGLQPDGLIINPADYMDLRLAKDSNGQYYGGGFFQGPYGNGGIQWQPPVWGLNTVVSSAVSAKEFVVGALKIATTVYRKGGVRVESTNSDQGKFTKDIITTRIEERLALAVRRPLAIVKGAFA